MRISLRGNIANFRIFASSMIIMLAHFQQSISSPQKEKQPSVSAYVFVYFFRCVCLCDECLLKVLEHQLSFCMSRERQTRVILTLSNTSAG